ncbi:Dak phosphatase, partial [mine drainage metagenome]
MAAFRDVWAGLGDSIAVVGGDGLYNCHIHTNDIGASIEAGLDAGRPRHIRVTDLAEQVIEERWVREADVVGTPVNDAVAPPTTAVVAVVVGDGVARIFRSLGVRAVVSGGQSMNPSTEEMVAAVRAVGSDQVVILPNNANIRPVAEQVAGLVDATVRVVPT